MTESTIAPDTWCLVELMGHRTRAGRVREVEIAGSKFLRIDVPTDDGAYVTEYYGGSSIYAITPGTEELIRHRFGEKALPARPVAYKDKPALPALHAGAHNESSPPDNEADGDQDDHDQEGEDFP